MTFESALIFAISLFLLWIKPGPGQVFKITSALNNGFWPAFSAASGIVLSCLIFYLVAVLGLQVITEFFYDIRSILKFVGGAYFLYIGYKGLKNIRSGEWTGRTSKTHKQSLIENFTAGFLLSASNPLDIVYFLGIMPTLMPLGVFTLGDIILGMGIIIGVALSVDVLVLLLVGQTKEALSNNTFVKRINLFTSIGFVLIGLFLFYSALFMGNFSFALT